MSDFGSIINIVNYDDITEFTIGDIVVATIVTEKYVNFTSFKLLYKATRSHKISYGNIEYFASLDEAYYRVEKLLNIKKRNKR